MFYYFIFIIFPKQKHYFFFHFIEGETEVQWGLSHLITSKIILNNVCWIPCLITKLFLQHVLLRMLFSFQVLCHFRLFHASRAFSGVSPSTWTTLPNPWLHTPTFINCWSFFKPAAKCNFLMQDFPNLQERLDFPSTFHSILYASSNYLPKFSVTQLIFIYLMAIYSGLKCKFYEGRDWICLAHSSWCSTGLHYWPKE